MYVKQPEKKENQIIGKTCDIIINRWTRKTKKITHILMIISQQFSQKKNDD